MTSRLVPTLFARTCTRVIPASTSAIGLCQCVRRVSIVASISRDLLRPSPCSIKGPSALCRTFTCGPQNGAPKALARERNRPLLPYVAQPPQNTALQTRAQSRKHPREPSPSTALPPHPPTTPQTPTRPPSPLRANLTKTLKTALPPISHENIYTLPNILTLSRLLATPLIAYSVLHSQHALALSLFLYAGVTDLLDGFIARKWNQQTVVGTVVDPIADKTLMTVLTVVLAVDGALPTHLATLILGRDASLAIAALYYRYASLPSPKTLARYWNFSLPSAEVHPTTVSKYNTFLQLVLIGATIALPLVLAHGWQAVGGLGVEEGMWYAQKLVAATTVYSGVSYLWARKAVVILNGDDARKRAILRRGRGIIAACFVGVAAVGVWLEGKSQAKAERRAAAEEKAKLVERDEGVTSDNNRKR